MILVFIEYSYVSGIFLEVQGTLRNKTVRTPNLMKFKI